MHAQNINAASVSKAEFLESVLRLQPKLAAFDCDGTLWSGDAGEGFFDWELRRGMFPEEIVRWARARYSDYRAGKVDEDTMCGEMVTMHKGMSEKGVVRAAHEFFDEKFVSRIFPEMRDLVTRLQDSGCEVWAVSSTNEWVIRESMKHFGVPSDHVIAAAVESENGIVTDRLIRVPSGEGKPRAIQEMIRRDPDAAFGNSRWDADMLKIAKHGFAVNPNPDLRTMAKEQGWTIYFPEPL